MHTFYLEELDMTTVLFPVVYNTSGVKEIVRYVIEKGFLLILKEPILHLGSIHAPQGWTDSRKATYCAVQATQCTPAGIGIVERAVSGWFDAHAINAPALAKSLVRRICSLIADDIGGNAAIFPKYLFQGRLEIHRDTSHQDRTGSKCAIPQKQGAQKWGKYPGARRKETTRHNTPNRSKRGITVQKPSQDSNFGKKYI
jgi:hypothetical protein